jgi:hypothetical protein
MSVFISIIHYSCVNLATSVPGRYKNYRTQKTNLIVSILKNPESETETILDLSEVDRPGIWLQTHLCPLQNWNLQVKSIIIQASKNDSCGTLYCGAVSSFYQHDESPMKRLADSEWKILLRGANRPGVPEWFGKYLK